ADEFVERHFQAWLDRWVHPDDREAVEKKIRDFCADETPEYWGNKSWPELREMAGVWWTLLHALFSFSPRPSVCGTLIAAVACQTPSMNSFRYTEEKLAGLRESLVDDRLAEYSNAELDIETALELVRLASIAIEIGKCGASDIDPRLKYVEVQIDRDL